MTDTNQQATSDLADASRYIRTYAKDLAEAGGGAAPTPTPAPEPVVIEKPLPEPVPEPIVTEKPLPPLPESVPEPIVTEKPLPPAAKERVSAPMPESDPERVAILERLKSKIASNPLPVMDRIQPTAPVFTEPVVDDVPRIPPIQQAPVAPPPPPPVLVPKTVEPESASPLHTYKTDFADEIDNKKASTFSVLAAEGNRTEKRPTVKKEKNQIIPVLVGSFFLIALGAGGVYGAYWFITQPAGISLQPLAPSLVFVDERVELKGPDYFNELARAAKEPLVSGNVLLTYITHSTSTPKTGIVVTPLPGGDLIEALGLSAPDILLRNIDRSSTVGVISAGGDTNPFFILRATSYERTYAGMLSWESTVAQDLQPFYPRPEVVIDETSFEAASTTPSTTAALIAPTSTYSAGFKDEIIENRDVRVLRDSSGRSVLLYGYRDKESLIIARNGEAFLELIRRLTAAGN